MINFVRQLHDMSTTELHTLLASAGVDPDNVPSPGGTYDSVVIRGNTAFVAIQFPIEGDRFLFKGVLGRDLQTAQGYEAAMLCAVNVLRQANRYIGIERIAGLNHFDCYYQCDDHWDDGPIVANGASDLFKRILGEKGRHTRAIMGVHKLPRNFSVGIVASFTLV